MFISLLWKCFDFLSPICRLREDISCLYFFIYADKEKALRLLKKYRERLTGIGDVHYLEEVAFLIHTFESPVFERLLRMGGTAQTSINKAQIKSETVHHSSEAKNTKLVSNGVLTEKDNSIVLSSDNSKTSISIDMSNQATAVGAGINSKEVSSHMVPVPSYSFYLTSNNNSQLSNTDSWGSIDLPMGDEKRTLDFEEHHLQSSGSTAMGSLTKVSVSNSPAALSLSPLSQIPSSNKSSSSSVSIKSVVTVGDSNKGPPSDSALVKSSSSQETPVAKTTAKKKEQHITVSLHKGKEGLGFSVVGLATEHKGDLGIYIQDIQKGGLAEK